MKYLFLPTLLISTLAAHSLMAGEVDVIAVKAVATGDRIYRFDVTLRHDDSGWDHYADRWEVLTPDGEMLGTRVLHHPHVNEQPFTRSLSGVSIPDGVDKVIIRGHDSVHGMGGKEWTLEPGN